MTLFHALPGAEETRVGEAVKAVCARTAPARIEVRGPWSLGRGVAYRLASPTLEQVRAELAARFEPWLTPQDRAPWRPHVTVQNKVEPQVAAALHAALATEHRPRPLAIAGLAAWHYRGGPWDAISEHRFRG